MANKFVIEVRAKGFTHLDQQLRSSDKAMQGFDKSARRSRRATKGLERGLGSVRNALLLSTDYMALSDVTMTDAWKTYRQSLRDITKTYQSMSDKDFKFPIKPS